MCVSTTHPEKHLRLLEGIRTKYPPLPWKSMLIGWLNDLFFKNNSLHLESPKIYKWELFEKKKLKSIYQDLWKSITITGFPPSQKNTGTWRQIEAFRMVGIDRLASGTAILVHQVTLVGAWHGDCHSYKWSKITAPVFMAENKWVSLG